MTSKLALVTGGSRGIGAVVVAQLRAAGWDVLAPGRNALNMDSTADAWMYASEVYTVRKRIDALIFCHGEWFSNADQSEQDWLHQYTQRVLASQLLITMLPEHQGVSITFVSSTQAFGGRAETGPYAAACAAQVRLALGLAQSVKGIRSNVVCPGLTDTSMAAAVRASGDCRPDAVAQPPEAVAGAVLRLVTGTENGKVLRVVDGQTTEAKWEWA